MSSLNKAMIIGRLGGDPEVRTIPSGECVATLNVATSETWIDKATNKRQDRTEWHRVVFFGRTAEVCRDYLKKGSLVYIEGSLQTRKWTDKNNVERTTTEIKGSEMRMLGSKGDNNGSAPTPSPASNFSAPTNNSSNMNPSAGGNNFTNVDDDIPF